MLCVAEDKPAAVSVATRTAFYLHTGFGKDATSHIDDRYGVDDIFEVKDILSEEMKRKFSISAEKNVGILLPEDDIHLGYFKSDLL